MDAVGTEMIWLRVDKNECDLDMCRDEWKPRK